MLLADFRVVCFTFDVRAKLSIIALNWLCLCPCKIEIITKRIQKRRQWATHCHKRKKKQENCLKVNQWHSMWLFCGRSTLVRIVHFHFQRHRVKLFASKHTSIVRNSRNTQFDSSYKLCIMKSFRGGRSAAKQTRRLNSRGKPNSESEICFCIGFCSVVRNWSQASRLILSLSAFAN